MPSAPLWSLASLPFVRHSVLGIAIECLPQMKPIQLRAFPPLIIPLDL